MADEQMPLDFSVSSAERMRTARKAAAAKAAKEQPSLFASWSLWTPNIDVHLHTADTAVASIAGQDPDRTVSWLAGLVGTTTSVNGARKVAFDAGKLDRLLFVRPPAVVTLDAPAAAVAKALWASTLGSKPLQVSKARTRIRASSPRSWPAWCKVVDAPWLTVAALLKAGVHVDVDDKAKAALDAKLSKSGQPVATAALAGTVIRLEAQVPVLLEKLRLPGLAYADVPGSGKYQMPILAAGCLLREDRIALTPAARDAIEKATRPVTPLKLPKSETFPWELYPFQARDAAQALRIVETIGGVLVAGDMGSGKAVEHSTKVLTPSGLRRAGDVCVGDWLMGVDGQPTQVLGVFPQGKREMFTVRFTDGYSAVVDREHLWTVNTPLRKDRGHAWKVLSTGELLEPGLRDGQGNLRWQIPVCAPLQFTGTDQLPVDPYLLGVLLGDGHMGSGGLTVTTADPFIAEEVRRLLPEPARVTLQPRSLNQKTLLAQQRGVDVGDVGDHTYRVTAAGDFRNSLKQLGVWGCRAWEKFVPDAYLYAPESDRRALLQGLLDTDGGLKNEKQRSSIEFTSTSERLTDAVAWLAQSLGGTARKGSPVRKTYTHRGEKKVGRPAWRVSLQLPAHVEPFRLPRKAERYVPRVKYHPSRAIKSIEPAGRAEAVCFKVAAEDEMFLLEHAIVTHNTTVSLAMVHELASWPLLVVAPLIAFSTWQRQLGEMGRTAYLATDSLEKSWQIISEGVSSGELDAVVIAYDRLHQFVDLIEQLHFAAVIADEAQRIRTPGSRRSRALRALASAIPIRVALSGTPLVNGVGDVLPLGAVVAPGEWRPRANEKDLADMYPGDPVQAVTDHLGSMMVRRTMADTGVVLPDRRDHRVKVQLHPEQRRELQRLTEEAQAAKESGELEAGGKFNALVKLQRMRQVINDPVGYGLRCPNPKITSALDLAERFIAEGRKGVIFCADRAVFTQLSQALAEDGVKHVGIWGSTPPHERIALEKQFHEDPDTKIVIATMQAASESVSFSPTGTFLIALAYAWQPALMAQRDARIRRMNQTEAVDIIQLHSVGPDGTVDDRMLEILEAKSILMSQVVDRTEYSDPAKVHYSMGDLVYMLTGKRDEKLDVSAADAKRVADEAARRKEHARQTLYAKKGRNKTDASIYVDDGSVTQTMEEYRAAAVAAGLSEELLDDDDIASVIAAE